MKVDVSKYITRGKFTYQNYLRKKAADSCVDLSNVGWGSKMLIYANEWQGEHFNNAVTAIGTAGVAPIFIINNPLAKEDKNTKKYTAARQPISAIITLAGQVPVMMAYNQMLDNYVTEHRLDRCDLHAAPPKSYYDSLCKEQTKKFMLENPEFIGNVKEKQIKQLFYDKAKNGAFYDELSKLRKIVHGVPFAGEENMAQVSSLLRSVMDENNFIKTEAMISPKDYSNAEKEILQAYLAEHHDVKFDAKGKIVKIGENAITDKFHQKDIKTVSDLKKSSIRNVLKKYGLNISKEEFEAIKGAITDDVIKQKAILTVEYENMSKAKAKFKLAQMAREAKAKLLHLNASLLKEGLSQDQVKEAVDKRGLELLNEMQTKVKELMETAKTSVPKGSEELTKDEAKYLFEKLTQRISNEYNPATAQTKGFLERAKLMIYNCFENDRNIFFLKTEGRDTLADTLRDQQVKKWLTTRINNSEKILKNFKTISGLIVGLGILPFTCGLLNWAYPRIMEEFFPNLAHAKSKPDKAKEVA